MVKYLTKVILAILFLLFVAPSIALAQQEFSTTYSVDYTVLESGTTHSKFTITLTNKLSNIYATEFSLSIGSTKLNNISVFNNSGPLEPKIATGTKTTSITIPFNDKVLGKNKSQIFYLEFDSLDFANRLGSIWEISIPKLSKSDDLTSYQLTLSIPQSFGKPAVFTPQPLSQTASQNQIIYRFKQADLFEKGISATFGHRQYFDFSFTYHLENPHVYPIKTEIALPPDTAFQLVSYQTLDPQPDNVIVDKDGNWLAQYSLSSKQNLKIIATGSATIFLNQRQDFPKIPLENIDDYLAPQKYWEADNKDIIKLAKELQTPKAIYQYVVENLIYDYGRLSDSATRFGAANALHNQDSAMCMEFTDLFVALSRAAGIPARAVNGFAYTTNSALRPLSLKKDVLHAWPEYFDQKSNTWIPIDPTWSNTTGGIDFFSKLDLNHFAFSFLGLDSNYPVPAGAYKTNDNQEKNVSVIFGKTFKPMPKTQIAFDLPKNALAGIETKGNIIIKNIGSTALYDQTIILKSQKFKLKQDQWLIDLLPPFASVAIPFSLPAGSFTDTFTDTLSASSNFSTSQHQLNFVPAYKYFLYNPLVIKTFALILLIITILLVLKLNLKNKKTKS